MPDDISPGMPTQSKCQNPCGPLPVPVNIVPLPSSALSMRPDRSQNSGSLPTLSLSPARAHTPASARRMHHPDRVVLDTCQLRLPSGGEVASTATVGGGCLHPARSCLHFRSTPKVPIFCHSHCRVLCFLPHCSSGLQSASLPNLNTSPSPTTGQHFVASRAMNDSPSRIRKSLGVGGR